MLKGHPGFHDEEAAHKQSKENPGFDSTLGLNITPQSTTKEGFVKKEKPRRTVGVGAVAYGVCILEALLYTRRWARWLT